MKETNAGIGLREQDTSAVATGDVEARSAPRLSEIARALEAKPFLPHPLYRGAHAQTLRGSLGPRTFGKHSAADERLFEVEPGVRLLAHCQWQAQKRQRPTLVLVHGLEGSSASSYMMGTARKAERAGLNVVRLNVRNCGGTEHLTPTLYHSGMSGDIDVVIRELIERDGLSQIFLAGFSLGGNLVLKLAGELGGEIPHEVAGVAAVSPSIDPSACATAIERPSNSLYRWSFIRSLRRRLRRKKSLFPNLYDTRRLREVHTIRQFDEIYTAAHGGFRDASDYYERSGALRFVERIRVPTLIIHAQDDPFVPFESFRHPAINSNPNIILLAPQRGGHVGFIAQTREGEDRFWAENRIVEFCTLLQGRQK